VASTEGWAYKAIRHDAPLPKGLGVGRAGERSKGLGLAVFLCLDPFVDLPFIPLWRGLHECIYVTPPFAWRYGTPASSGNWS